MNQKKKKKKGAVDNLILKGSSDPFRTVNYHDNKMYNTVVPPKILLHKKECERVQGIFVDILYI